MVIRFLTRLTCLVVYILLVPLTKAAHVSTEVRFLPISHDVSDRQASEKLLSIAARNSIQAVGNGTDIFQFQGSHRQHHLPLDSVRTTGLQPQGLPNKHSWASRKSRWPVLSSRVKRTQDGSGLLNEMLDKPTDIRDEKKWTHFSSWGKRNIHNTFDGYTDKRWKEMSVWGKRHGLDNTKRWKEIAAWGKRDAIDNTKKWKEMSVWGKRDDIDNMKKWKEMTVWGKRDDIDNMKKWKEMSVWGKRDDVDNMKKWKEMSVWGKRDDIDNMKKWKEMSVWGKRDDIDNMKKWKEMSVWGKRDDIDNIKKWKEMSVWGKRDDIDNTKKWREMSVWGKRDDIDNTKKWKEMSVWGKRDDIDNTKKWKEMSVWGKREDIDNTKKWKEMSVWGKRNWNVNRNDIDMTLWRTRERASLGKKWKSLSAWGKRDPISEVEKERNYMSLWGSGDTDYTGTLNNVTIGHPQDVINMNKKWKEMTVWGKRSSEGPDVRRLNELPLWGKRTFRRVRNWRDMDMWGKRPSWSKTGFTSWGKRSPDVYPSTYYLHQLQPLTDWQEAQTVNTEIEKLEHLPNRETHQS